MIISSHIVFVIALVLSTSKYIPERTIEDLALFGAVLETGIFFLFIINWKKFKKEKWNNTVRNILIMVSLFFMSLLISLLWNIKDYGTFSSLVLMGLSNIAVIMLLPISWIVFSASFNLEHRWIGIGMLIFVHIIGIGQFLNIPGVSSVIQGTSGIMGIAPERATSIFSASTVYGGFSAITFIFGLTALINVKFWSEESIDNKNFLKILFNLLVFMSLIGGILSLSRNFFVGVLAGIGAFAMKLKNKKILITLFLLIICGIHIIIVFNSTAALRFGEILPYFTKLHNNRTVELKDFIPRFDDSSLSGRITVWKRALNLWKEHPLIGCGPGSFRNKSIDDKSVSVNNFYLQVLAEGGILAFIFALSAIFILWRSLIYGAYFPMFVSAAFMLIFDNFLDASAPWVLTLAYVMSWPVEGKTIGTI